MLTYLILSQLLNKCFVGSAGLRLHFRLLANKVKVYVITSRCGSDSLDIGFVGCRIDESLEIRYEICTRAMVNNVNSEYAASSAYET